MGGILTGFGLGMMMVSVIYGLDILLCGKSGLPRMENPPPPPLTKYERTIKQLKSTGKFYSSALYLDDKGKWVYAKFGDRFGDKKIKTAPITEMKRVIR